MFDSQKRSVLLSWLLHCGAILLILATTGVKPQTIAHIRDVLWMPANLAPFKMPVRQAGDGGGGGGGGGAHAQTAASRGDLPRFDIRQISVARTDPNPAPILPWEATLVGIPDNQPPMFIAASYGSPTGVIGPKSDGTGGGGGIGDLGRGTGIGPGKGPGGGPGDDGGQGGGVNFLGAGGSVISPELLTKVDPNYSEDARKARLQGSVMLRIEVGTNGLAQNITVAHGLGLGLDEEAMDAVKKWKFRPGKVNGKPAVVVAYVEVNFRLL